MTFQLLKCHKIGTRRARVRESSDSNTSAIIQVKIFDCRLEILLRLLYQQEEDPSVQMTVSGMNMHCTNYIDTQTVLVEILRMT